MLIAGIDDNGPHLYETDPSGAMMAYKAGGIGAGVGGGIAGYNNISQRMIMRLIIGLKFT